MSKRLWGKYAGAGVAGVVLAAGLTTVAPSAHAAQPTPDAAAITWLTNQLGDDDLVGGDLSTTIDFGTALAAAGGAQATLDRIKSVVDAGVAGYVIGDGTDGVNAAQAALYYDEIGVDPTTVDGNLITKIEAAVSDVTGMNKAQYGYEGAWSQGLAVRALQAAGSGEAGKATDFLAGMACDGGGWGDTTCSFGADPDDTADALFALIPLTGHGLTTVDDAVTAGIGWLKANQQEDGSFFNWSDNASSTGLAAHALMMHGDLAEATKAATWLRARQIAGTPCDGKLSGEGGSVAYSDGVIASGKTDGIAADPGAKYDWFASTVQALPALTLAPTTTSGLSVSAPAWVKAGSTVSATGNGLAAGQRGCVSLAGKNLDVVGGATKTRSFAIPNGTKAYSAILRVRGASASTKVVALAPKTLTVGRSAKVVAKGGTEKIKVSGLYAGEAVRIKYNGAVVASGVASSTGTFVRSINVGRAAGAKTAYVLGRFDTRKGNVGFTVR